mmetsp:Transcript_15170/g.21639  ORF Transcript_15170/g.21639 Transcript_15170/m.21639 type:complete len:586 (+) Transcript_15170:130-1887(+)
MNDPYNSFNPNRKIAIKCDEMDDERKSYLQERYENGRRRLDVIRFVHKIWTEGGSDDSGLAGPFLDGRVRVLGCYLRGDENDDDEIMNEQKEEETTGKAKMRLVDGRDLSYENFFHNHMDANIPVVIKGLTKDWGATNLWTRVSLSDPCEYDNNDPLEMNERKQMLVPNLDYLRNKYGDESVSVHLQENAGFRNSNSGSMIMQRQKVDMDMNEYANWWQEYCKTRRNNWSDNDKDDDSSSKVLKYLKDWKFVSTHPQSDGKVYSTPFLFADDWLNGPVGCMGAAYRFCYLGPKGTVTPLHVDVLNSYSWSSNVCGKKEWYLLHPSHTHLLYHVFGNTLAPHFHADLEISGIGVELYPGLARARQLAIRVIQEQGQTIFVPSGWHHTVENLEDTLSINHNWLNGTNICKCWERVKGELSNSSLFGNNGDQFNAVVINLNDMSTYHAMDKMVESCNKQSIPSISAILNNIKNNQGRNGNSSFDEGDIYLLWLIISKRGRSIMKETRVDKSLTHPYSEQMKFQITYDLTRILYVATNITDLLNTFNALNQNTDEVSVSNKDKQINMNDLHTLINDITSYLKSKNLIDS